MFLGPTNDVAYPREQDEHFELKKSGSMGENARRGYPDLHTKPNRGAYSTQQHFYPNSYVSNKEV